MLQFFYFVLFVVWQPLRGTVPLRGADSPRTHRLSLAYGVSTSGSGLALAIHRRVSVRGATLPCLPHLPPATTTTMRAEDGHQFAQFPFFNRWDVDVAFRAAVVRHLAQGSISRAETARLVDNLRSFGGRICDGEWCEGPPACPPGCSYDPLRRLRGDWRHL